MRRKLRSSELSKNGYDKEFRKHRKMHESYKEIERAAEDLVYSAVESETGRSIGIDLVRQLITAHFELAAH